MKILKNIIVVFGIFLFSSCSLKKTITDIDNKKVRGRIKSFTSTPYVVNEKLEKEKVNGMFFNYQYIFDKKGNKKEDRHFKPDGSLLWKNTYKYDDKGRLIEKIDGFWKNGKETYKYDENRLIERKKGYDKWLITYKPNERIEKSYNNTRVYKYDENKNKIEETQYNLQKEIERKKVYTYDEKGNKTSYTRYSLYGYFYEKYVYRYNKKGLKIEEDYYKKEGELVSTRKFEYDKYGNEVMIKRYLPNGDLDEVERYEYKYDKNKNWISRIYYKNDKPIEIVERKFEYFE